MDYRALREVLAFGLGVPAFITIAALVAGWVANALGGTVLSTVLGACVLLLLLVPVAAWLYYGGRRGC